MKFSTTVAALIVAATTVSAQGSAIIMNHCEFPTYLWAVDSERDPQSPTTIAPGESYSEPYHTPSSGGVSLKVSNSQSIVSVTQFEYTLAGQIFYDGSNINCQTSACPFWQYNLYIEASEGSCPGRPCTAQTACSGFYEAPDDVDTLACSGSANTILHLCLPTSELPTSQDSVSIPEGQAASSQAPAAPAPAASTSSSNPPAPPPTTTSKAVINERPVATTFVTVTATDVVHRAARDIHAHARRHLHHRA